MEISLQNATEHSCSNGVKIYILHSEEFEVLRLSFIFGAGSVHQTSPFVASATANLLSEGSETMTSLQIAEKLDYYGSYYDVNIDRDHTYINFCSLTKFVETTLEVAEQIILHPTFPSSEIETYAAKRKQRLTIERRRIETKAREEFAHSLFGPSHPYGVSSPTEAYDTLSRESVEEFYKSHYCASNCFVVCSGRVTEAELQQIVRLVEAIPQNGEPPAVNFPDVVQRPYHFVEDSNAVQSSIRIGRRLFTRSHPDFLGMQVVATILGGYFGSRLMQSLREERGYTYGVVSALVNFAAEGYLAVATQVGCEVADDALQIIYNEIERLRTEEVGDEELTMVKHIMAGEMMRILDGPFGIADVTIENILCGTDNSIIAQNLERIEAITPADILRLSQSYLGREDLITVVAGKAL
ncbi:MAG: pitrilysin family protein [Rikenellaceae bacterium]